MKLEVERALKRIIMDYDFREAADKKAIEDEIKRKAEVDQQRSEQREYGFGYGFGHLPQGNTSSR